MHSTLYKTYLFTELFSDVGLSSEMVKYPKVWLFKGFYFLFSELKYALKTIQTQNQTNETFNRKQT